MLSLQVDLVTSQEENLKSWWPKCFCLISFLYFSPKLELLNLNLQEQANASTVSRLAACYEHCILKILLCILDWVLAGDNCHTIKVIARTAKQPHYELAAVKGKIKGFCIRSVKSRESAYGDSSAIIWLEGDARYNICSACRSTSIGWGLVKPFWRAGSLSRLQDS